MNHKVNNQKLLTFSEHLEVFRKLLLRVLGVTACIAIIVFYFKNETFEILLAPSESDFVTYRLIECIMKLIVIDFHFDSFYVNLIATDLSSQFMAHITTSAYLGLLGASPYILYELFRFVSPALYDNEKKYSVRILVVVYLLFMFGILMSYYVLFPFSFRFLGTYVVSEKVQNTINIDSYISTFVTLTLLMACVFQLPVVTYVLGKMGVVNAKLMSNYRKHAFLIIMFVASVITPPDIMTLIVVAIPLYLLYEISIRVVRCIEK